MSKDKWDSVILPNSKLINLHLSEIWRYRDLLFLFIRRDIVVTYKQTILGPLWFFIQPILTTLIFIIVFGNIAGISTDNIPQPLFYLSGIVIWNYFSECFTKTSNTFTDNSYIFGKVYFPRLIAPLSIIISNGLKFLIQFGLFLCLYLYFVFTNDLISPNKTLLLLPFIILLMALFGLGFGLIFSSLTSKYKDLKFLLQFGIQLMMYTTPIIYPFSSIPDKFQSIMWYNPFVHIIESFKHMFFGVNQIDYLGLIYALILSLVFCFAGILIFNRTEKTFMDNV